MSVRVVNDTAVLEAQAALQLDFRGLLRFLYLSFLYCQMDVATVPSLEVLPSPQNHIELNVGHCLSGPGVG